MNDYSVAGLRWQTSALLALQEATEAFLVHLFEDACVLVIDNASLVEIGFQESMRHPRQASHYNAARYPVGSTYTRSLGGHGLNFQLLDSVVDQLSNICIDKDKLCVSYTRLL